MDMIVRTQSLTQTANALFSNAFAMPTVVGQKTGAQAVFFGTGLVTPKALSLGMPFDFLSMLATAQQLKHSHMTGDDTMIVHYIPDVTALQNDFVTADAIVERADSMEKTARGLAQFFGIAAKYHVVRGREIEASPVRQNLLERSQSYVAKVDMPDAYKGYLAEQLADMAYLHTQHNGRIKLSWTMARNANGAGKGLDESFFDGHFNQCFGQYALEFAYIQPGRRLDSKANRACPYTYVAGEPRLTLGYDASLKQTVEHAGLAPDSGTAREAIKYWNDISDALEGVFGLNNNAPCRVDGIRRKLACVL